jgi:YHS domain-containing protein
MLRAVLEFVFILLAARAFWRLVGGIVQGITGQPRAAARPPEQAVSMVRDPVCGIFVLPDRAVTISDGRGRVHFCSTACRDKYRSRTA